MMEDVGVPDTLASFDLPLALHAAPEAVEPSGPRSGRRSGKVRESWPLTGGRRLLVTTDRLSAFDRIIGTVANKGQVLNQLSGWWFARTADIVANHLLEIPDPNAAIVIDAEPLPIEVVVRARLTGSTSTSLLPRYEAGERDLYGHRLPDGLAAHGPLDHPIITPTTKAGGEAGHANSGHANSGHSEAGHDEPVGVDEVVDRGLLDRDQWDHVKAVALELFDRGQRMAADAGFVLADTKYEFGLVDGQLLLIDEVHTPDSSRYWSIDSLQSRLDAGLGPESFDKEPVRLALRQLGYSGDGPPPELPESVLAETSARYVTLYESLTGQRFEPGERPIEPRLTRNLHRHVGPAPLGPTDSPQPSVGRSASLAADQ